MALKDNIRNRRNELRLTLEDVAQYIGVSRQTVQKYESGVVLNIPSDKIERMAEILKTTPTKLMGWEEKKPTVENGELTELEKIFMDLPVDRREEVLRYMRYVADQKENGK